RDGALRLVADHRVCVHLQVDQKPAGGRTRQCPARGPRSGARDPTKDQRMTDVAQGFTAGVGHSRGEEGTHGHVPGESSMWFFVIGDLLIFGVYFVVYMCYRTQHHDLFLRGQAQLNLDVGAVNTVMLLTSSLFVALGVAAARAGDAIDARRRFWAALTFGAVFPLLKLFEWIPEITAGLTPGKNLFFMFYFVMTGM